MVTTNTTARYSSHYKGQRPTLGGGEAPSRGKGRGLPVQVRASNLHAVFVDLRTKVDCNEASIQIQR